MSLTEDQIRKFIDTLSRNPELRRRMYEVIKPDDYVRRDEMNEILQEIKLLRQESNKRFEELIETMDKRFEAVDKRFEEIISQMDKRFEAVDKRFEAVDKRFEEIISQMDKRFEAVDKRFEAVDKRFEEIISQMDKRFEAVDKRFEAVDKRFEELIKELKAVKAEIGSIGGRTGIAVEKTILEVMREAIMNEGIAAETIKKIEKFSLRDKEGKFFHAGAKVEFDGIIRNDRIILLEIKYKPSKADVLYFTTKAKVFEYYEKQKPELWLIAMEIPEMVLELAELKEIKVIYSQIASVRTIQ